MGIRSILVVLLICTFSAVSMAAEAPLASRYPLLASHESGPGSLWPPDPETRDKISSWGMVVGGAAIMLAVAANNPKEWGVALMLSGPAVALLQGLSLQGVMVGLEISALGAHNYRNLDEKEPDVSDGERARDNALGALLIAGTAYLLKPSEPGQSSERTTQQERSITPYVLSFRDEFMIGIRHRF